MKKLIAMFIVFVLAPSFFTGIARGNDWTDFILPESGGSMAHCDPRMSDCTHLPVPNGNVNVVWHRRELPGEKAGSFGLGFSSNGNISACTFQGCRDNLVVYDYDGHRLWSSGDLLNALALASAPMIDVHGRVIACDNKVILMVDPLDYDADGDTVEWISELPEGGLPISPVITQNGTIILATVDGPVYAYDSRDGTLLAWKYITADEPINKLFPRLPIKNRGFFDSANTPCVKGNRVYISTQYNSNGGLISFYRYLGRLYAIDVDPDNPHADERLTIAWYYQFSGPSGASPLLINDTIYFDGNCYFIRRPGKMPEMLAVTDMGDYCVEKWRAPMPHYVEASFAQDPRGGYWIVDVSRGCLTHYATENGHFIEDIDVDSLVSEAGKHIPCSVITISGNDTHPILVVGVVALFSFRCSSYVIAVDLANHNALLWKVKIAGGSIFSLDFPFGQYPIMMKNGEPRIVFASVRGGAWAIGNFPG